MDEKPSAAAQPEARRRWYQFSLRMLLIVVTALAVPCAYLGWQAKIVSHRKLVLKSATEHGLILMPDAAAADAVATVPWIRRMMGDVPVRSAWWVGASKEDRERFAEAFPEATVESRW